MNFSKLLQWSMLLSMAAVRASPVQAADVLPAAVDATTTTSVAATTTTSVAATSTSVSSAPVSSETAAAANTTYRITVINNSGTDNNYGLFLQQPNVASVPDKDIWTNVWVYQRVASMGSFTLNAASTFYAWVGQAPQAPVPGVVIQGGVGQAVSQLGGGGKLGSTYAMTNDDGIANFVFPNPAPTAITGSFQINTDTSFTPNNLFLLGLGAINPISGVIVPAGVIAALPNQKYTISPVVKFYISAGVWQPGEIVDIGSESGLVGVIDFSSGPGLGNFGCNIIQGVNGVFSAVYSPK